jgi:hypothetical protein
MTTTSAPIIFRRARDPYPVGNATLEQVNAARAAIGFGAIFNHFTSDEVAEIIYRARTMSNPPPRPPVERRCFYRTTPFAGMGYDSGYPDPFHPGAPPGVRHEHLVET